MMKQRAGFNVLGKRQGHEAIEVGPVLERFSISTYALVG